MSRQKIRSIIDSTYPLKQAARAHARMAAGSLFGKILLKPQL
jgi:NADPH:quinone reductase-like Zn-dependent oxidoreductase